MHLLSKSLFKTFLIFISCLFIIDANAQKTRPVKSIRVRPGEQNKLSGVYNSNDSLLLYGMQKDVASQTIFSHFTEGSITLDIAVVNTTCENANGSIAITATGGTTPYTYSLEGYYEQSTGLFSQLPAGDFNIKVTDASGETATTSCTLTNNFPRPKGNINQFVFPTGCSAGNGSVVIDATGGSPPYSFSLDRINYQTSNVFSNLYAGWYVYFIRDANGCGASVNTVALDGGYCPMGFTGSYTSYVCGNNGEITIDEVVGGTAPYLFSGDGINYGSGSVVTGYSAGVNEIYIKDATDKVFVYAFQMFDYCILTLDAVVKHPDCGNSNGTITAKATNGQEPYLYSLDGINFQNSTQFKGLAPGKYMVTVKDANNSIATTDSLVIGTGCLNISTVVKNTTCDYNNGSITINATDGAIPYKYSLDGINFTDSNIFYVGPGNYTIWVQDATGLSKSVSATVGSAPGPALSVKHTNFTCLNPGTITLTAIGGTPPYQYSLEGIWYQDSPVFLVGPGPNSTYVKDSNGCVFQLCCTWIEYKCIGVSASATNASCGNSNGIIVAKAESGFEPYVYSIDGINYSSNNTFSNLKPGDYTVIAKGKNGESDTTFVTIGETCVVVDVVVKNAACGNNNGTITASATNGAAPYLYSLDGVAYSSNNVFLNLIDGNYTVYAKDANGFVAKRNITVTNTPGPNISYTVIPAGCSGFDGSIIASQNGGAEPVLFSLSNGAYQSSGTFTSLDPGMFVISAKDNSGCINSVPVKIDVSDTISVDAGENKTICEGSAIQLAASSDGNIFAWSAANSLSNVSVLNPFASPTTTTTYFLTASSRLCTNTDSVTIFVHNAPVANAGTDTAICFGKSILLNGSGGINYKWSPSTYLSGVSLQDPFCSKPQQTITYSLEVSDNYGCSSLNDAKVTVVVTPSAKVFAGNDTSVAKNQPLQLNAYDVNQSGFISYTWTPSVGLDNPYIKDPIAVLQNEIIYEVTATALGDCQAKDTIHIKVYNVADIYVPSAFSPNGDGRNDLLRPIGVGIREFKYFMVYDRWGNQVFHSTDIAKGWDGILNGKPQSFGTYVWMVAGIDYNGKAIQKKGTVLLLK